MFSEQVYFPFLAFKNRKRFLIVLIFFTENHQFLLYGPIIVKLLGSTGRAGGLSVIISGYDQNSVWCTPICRFEVTERVDALK